MDDTSGPLFCEYRRAAPSAPTVLLLHGLTASHVSWRPIADRLPEFNLVIPDLLGFGASPKPDCSYDLETHCAALRPIVEQSGPAVVVGHSMGAVVALGLVARYPSIATAILISPTLFANHAEAVELMHSAPLMQRMTVRWTGLAHLACSVACALRPLTKTIAPFLVRDLPPDVVRAGFDHTWTSYSRSLAELVVSGLGPRLLASHGSRAVLIHGLKDPTVPLELALRYRSLVARFETVEGDHEALLKNPEPIAHIIQEVAQAPAALSDLTPGD
ncbi:MAG: alpha/beta fold hydrolase [Tepidiformaceae bacterium]